MTCANNRVHYRLVVYGYLHITLPHYHHYADLSEGIELLKCVVGGGLGVHELMGQ